MNCLEALKRPELAQEQVNGDFENGSNNFVILGNMNFYKTDRYTYCIENILYQTIVHCKL